MASVVSVIQKLELFIEKSYRLERKEFVKRIEDKNKRTGATLTVTIGRDIPTRITTQWSGLSEDEIDAFLLNFRLFIQDGDGISIDKIREYYNRYLPLQQDLVDRINYLSKGLRNYMKEETNIAINGEKIKRSKIFSVFLWGGFAHLSPKEKLIYDNWNMTPFYHFLLGEFIKILSMHLKVIREIRETNYKAIGSIRAVLFWSRDFDILKRKSYPSVNN